MKRQNRTIIRMIALLATVSLLAAAAGVQCFAAGGNGAKLPDGFLTYLAECAKKGEKTVDVSAFGVTLSDAVKKTIRDYLFEECPELFLLQAPVGFSFYSTGELTSVSLNYACSAAEYGKRIKEVEAAANRLLKGIVGNTALTEVQKALLLHDRLAVHCEYDEGVLKGKEPRANARNIYGALVERVAVCDGYSRTYMYLLGKAGIKSRINRSDALVHSWNIVYIGGKAYHVDVTFDDPTHDMTGRVNHENFLLSSAALYRTNHAASDYDTEPNDTKFDDYYWQKSTSSFMLAGGKVYYIDNLNATLNRYDGTKVLSLSKDWGGWYAKDKYQTFCFARGASDGTVLLYNDSKSVYEFDPATGNTKTVFTPNASGGKMIFGMALDNGKILCEMTDSPVRTSADKSDFLVSKAYAEHAPAIKLGDPDGDGAITSADARLALRASVGLEKYARGSAQYKACNVDGDNEITSADARLILRASVGLENASRWK